MSYRYLVLGTGVGKAIAHKLLAYPSTGRVVLGDVDGKRANVVVSRLRALHSGKVCQGIEFKAEMPDAEGLFRNFDVVVSALPAKYNPRLARAAIHAETHFCDLGGIVDITKKIMKLDQEARKSKVTIIPDCGLMPGLGVMLARLLMEEFEFCHSVHIFAGGLPQKPKPPIFYQRVFSLEGLKHICFDETPALVDGRVEIHAPFSGYEVMVVPELSAFSPGHDGRVEAFLTAGASVAPWTFSEWGVKNFWEKTVRWPGFVSFIKDPGNRITPENFEEKIAPHVGIPVDAKHPDLVWMRVEAKGVLGGKEESASYTLLDRFEPHTGLTAMERATGFPTAALARMMARGITQKGVFTPERAMSFEHLKKFVAELMPLFKLFRN